MESKSIFPILLGVLAKLPGTAVSESAANADRAQAAAELAQQHSVGFEDGGTGLILKPIEQEA